MAFCDHLWCFHTEERKGGSGVDKMMEMFLHPANYSISLNLAVLLVIGLYLVFTGPLRKRFPDSEPPSIRQLSYFLTAALIFYFSLGSPMEMIGHELFSIHMVQMSLLFIVMPPFLLMGLPGWMVAPVFRLKGVGNLAKVLVHPVFATFFFNGMIWLYHLPWVFDRLMEVPALHTGARALLLIGGVAMWFSVLCPVPEMDKMSELKKMGYLYANGMLLTPACIMIAFSDTPFFALFHEQSQMFPILTPLHDQQLGGVLMKIIQEIVYVGVIVYIFFFQWVRKEREKDRLEAEESAGNHPVSQPVSESL
ncbi:CtaG like protein [Desmospora sp. 8437]|nr:CtaG like protein [Desmospora sp. 8437]